MINRAILIPTLRRSMAFVVIISKHRNKASAYAVCICLRKLVESKRQHTKSQRFQQLPPRRQTPQMIP